MFAPTLAPRGVGRAGPAVVGAATLIVILALLTGACRAGPEGAPVADQTMPSAALPIAVADSGGEPQTETAAARSASATWSADAANGLGGGLGDAPAAGAAPLTETEAATPAPPADGPPADGLPADGLPAVPLEAEPLAPEEPHPLQIAWLRARDFPPSDLVIERTLSPGANYDRHVVWYLSDGLKIYALLTVPRGERPASGWPAVVFNHGYIPPAQYRTEERYLAYTDAFARNGYIVLKPDYRGHGSSEGVAGGGYGSPDYTVDVLHALASVRRHPEADPERVAMWGHSMGGHITLRAMVVSSHIRAGVIWAGVVGSHTDLLERWRRRDVGPTPTPRWPRRWRDDLVALYGAPQDNPAFWASLSANSYLADLSGPIQLHHGTADTSVPLAFSEQLHADLQAIGRPSELYVYQGDDHNISRSLSQALQRSVAFFDTHVKGVP